LASHTFAETAAAIEGIFNRFNGEIGMATIYYLEESDLWVTG